MIHRKTGLALTLATIGGYAGGSIDGLGGLLVAIVVAGLAIAMTPNAETVAAGWIERRERERIEEASER